MKSKIFLLVCLFMGTISLNSFAQDKANNATQDYKTIVGVDPVFCDDVQVDLLYVDLTVHFVQRTFKKGPVLSKEIQQLHGTVTSLWTGEVFKFREIDKWTETDHFEVKWHYNAKGDQGNHYLGTITYNLQTGDLTIGNTVCN